MTVIRTPKKICQTASMTSSVTTVYTTPANTITQVTELWLTNTSLNADYYIEIYAHGTAGGNMLAHVVIPKSSATIIDEAKIVLAAGEVLATKTDGSTNVNLTVYGVEEVTS